MREQRPANRVDEVKRERETAYVRKGKDGRTVLLHKALQLHEPVDYGLVRHRRSSGVDSIRSGVIFSSRSGRRGTSRGRNMVL